MHLNPEEPDFLQSLFDRWGLPCERIPVEPGRDNLVARLDGSSRPHHDGGLVLFAAHQDTVPVEGMTIDPFAGVICGGRLYGRGACDVKGGMAAMLWAIGRLAAEQPASRPTIIMACTVNEEYGFTGAKALATIWKNHRGIIPRAPDAAIVAEPTDLNVVVAHKGVVRWRVCTTGRAVHSSRPEAGDNAIYKMARTVAVLERYHREELRALHPHPLCGPATLSVGTIRGGASVNVVPDQCTIEVDRRLLPQEDPQGAFREAVDYVDRHTLPTDRPEHNPPFMVGYPLSQADNGVLAERLAQVAAQVTGQCERVGVPYATDAAFFAAAGVPSVVFGPGSIEQAHTADEWVSLDQVRHAAEIFYRLARDWPDSCP